MNELDVSEYAEQALEHATNICWSLGLAALVVVLAACSSGGRPASNLLGAKVTASRPSTTLASTTTLGSTTTLESTTTTTIYDLNLQDHLVAAPAGYSYASSVGDLSNPNARHLYSGELQTTAINGMLGVPTAARDLHFQTGYAQIYQNDSAPLSVDKAIEVDLYRFDTPADASKFVQQRDRRSIGAIGNPTTTSNVVAGVPGALSVDETTKEPSGLYFHNVLASKGTVAISLWFLDLTRGTSVFLRTLAAQEYAVL
jgi:hypothetical protein